MTATPGTVVVGIIDDGLAFAHERFRNGTASRVEYWWLQDGVHLSGPTGFYYGRELDKADIDALLTQCTSAGLVDEDELYQRAGLNDFSFDSHKSAAWRQAHGTHVMDLACGFDANEARDDRPIVCVQLPIRVVANTSGAGLHTYAMDGIDYILCCADRIAAKRGVPILPVVINLSYGTIGGPHDGTSLFERFVSDRVAQRKARGSTLDVVLPAGNSHLSRCHAQVDFANKSAMADLFWRILPDDHTPSYVDVWLPPRRAGSRSRIALTVTPPYGADCPQPPLASLPPGLESPPIEEGSTAQLNWTDASGGVYCRVFYRFLGGPTGRGRFRICVQPTYSPDRDAPIAPSGVWTIRLKNRSLTPAERVHAWIHRDDTLYGHPIRGRQSYFDHRDYKRYGEDGRDVEVDDTQSLVRHASLLNALATGRDAVVVGGYVRSTRKPAKYSSAGPVTKPKGANAPPRRGPDALAPSDDSLAHPGVLAAASRSGAVVAMNGTSVAVPQIARWLADQRAKGETGRGVDLVRARAQADESASPGPNPPINPEPPRSGRVNLLPLNSLSRP
jgi:hypothetical protein